MPAIVFAFCLFKFLSAGGISPSVGETLHRSIYIIGACLLLVQVYFNKGKGIFCVITFILFYTLLNRLRTGAENAYSSDIVVQTLIALLPYNLLLFYIYYPYRLISRKSLFLSIGILMEYGVVETLLKADIAPLFFIHEVNVPAAIGFACLITYAFVKSVKEGDFWDYTILYIGISSATFCLYKISGMEMFVALNIFFVFIYIIYSIIYEHFFDKHTGLKNRNSYRYYASKLPLKYSVAIIKIDFYDDIARKIGLHNMKTIVTMINDIFQEYIGNDLIFRIYYDEFIFIYKKFDIKEAYSHIEEVRRTIAGLNFVYAPKKSPLKITISCGVSEKKRSDKDVYEVAARAENAMRDTAKFSNNVTTKA